MICARGALRAGGLTVSRVRRLGTIDAVGSRCLRSRDYRQKAGVRPVAKRGLRTRRRLPWSGARAFTPYRPLRRSYGHAHEQNIAWHRAFDMGGLAFLRARARGPGGGATPLAEPLGSCRSAWPDANHGSATTTLAHLKMGASMHFVASRGHGSREELEPLQIVGITRIFTRLPAFARTTTRAPGRRSAVRTRESPRCRSGNNADWTGRGGIRRASGNRRPGGSRA